MGSGQSTPAAIPPPAAAKTSGEAAKPKPCCVCKDEKAARDECMLFSTSSNAQEECTDLVSKYKDCMSGFGFKI
ncbi:hypothetical protein P154DRAFT_580035 [Amniculicola lignicola CBS 123094]|uniref:Uncharacterized protein n=1 Tax=Amniculicola lignicola CBS 123094 TaxID=1392246 RepID=A0A6A5WAW1_9PLEO|nr:hypothetical protein P154DRAFT_580035 [Amniculicola lignicola CBS 123094]